MTVAAANCGFAVTTGFAPGNTAIVAKLTHIKSIGMGKGTRHISPRRRRYTVAIVTGICRIRMTTGFARGNTAIMATNAASRQYLGMIQWADKR